MGSGPFNYYALTRSLPYFVSKRGYWLLYNVGVEFVKKTGMQ